MKKGRYKDWADYEAERLFDLVRDALDDELVIAEIAKSLRKSAAVMHGRFVSGPVGEHPKEEDDEV